MNFPQNLKYTNEHEWIRVDGELHTLVSPIMHRNNWAILCS